MAANPDVHDPNWPSPDDPVEFDGPDVVIDDNPAKEIIDDTVAGNVVAGILQMTTGFVVVIVGVLIWSGII